MAVIAFSAVGASARGDIPGYRNTTHGALIDDLESLGHTLVEPDNPDATHFVSLDHNAKSLAAASSTVPIKRRILVVYEPRVVIPANYRPSIRRLYGRIISMSATPDAAHLDWPQRDWRASPPASPVRLPGSTAVVNANKLSSVRGSLYGLRRRVIERFARDRLPLTLAGANWERRGTALLVENAKSIAYALLNRELVDLREWARPVPTSGTITHLGRVEDKDTVLLASEFAVVIENSAAYLSEKLFDAVIAGCVPLYVGPPLALYGIPDSIAVILPQRAEAFTEAVRSLTADEKRAVLRAGRTWLADDETHRRWAMPNALARLADEISHAIETEKGDAQ